MTPFFGRLLVRAAAGSILLAAITAIPAWLVLAIGWPLPQQLPTVDTLASWINGTVTDQMVVDTLAVAIWLVWLLFVQAVAAELAATIRSRRTPRRHVNPLRTMAATLVCALLLGSFLTTTAAASPAPARATTPVTAPVTAAAAVSVQTGTAEGPATILVGDTRYSYIVKRGDYLSKISKAWLGSADRWPEICELNKHRHFPKVGGTLHNCNLIHPGWNLRLPADARPPADAKPAQPPAPPPPRVQDPDDGVIGEPTPSPSASVSPSAPASRQATASPSPAAAHPVVPTVPAASATASAAASATASSPASASPSADASADASATAPAPDDQGVRLPDGSWVTWTLAAAITAAAALVWLQRRRRFTGELDADDPPTQLPPPVMQLRRAVAHHPELTLHADQAEQAAAVPELATLPPGGIGVQGDGARAAARAALVATLASGGPHHPHRRGEVVIDAATLATLIGSDTATLGPWPRLHIAEGVDDALTIIEAQLLHRARILDEHCLSDLDTLRQQAPYEEALPPILLVADSPPPGARMRTKASLTLGADLHVSAILLGEWAHGATIEVAADGHTKLLSGQPAEPVPPRLPVLQADTAMHILGTLHEAHTGQPPAAASSTAPTIPLLTNSATDPALALQPPQPAVTASAGAGGRKARLCVLGPPRIEDITKPGRDLRSKARELAVFLACHPDGVSTRDIGEYLEPDARIDQSDQRVHTNASNLRHNLARAGSTDAKNAYVVKDAGRYRLDSADVQVDIWQLRMLLRTGSVATGEHRRELLHQACDLYAAPLAEGQDYEWITPHREAVRRWGIEAHLLLADDLLDTNPQSASTLLDKAIGLDRYNEVLYRKAMHARHALGDTDGIRTLLRALTKALADLDAEPEEDTAALATQLRISLEPR